MDRKPRSLVRMILYAVLIFAGILIYAYGWQVTDIVVPDPAEDEWPVCDEHTHDWLLRQIETTDIVLSVGSGVLSDLGKWIAFDMGVPYVCFATAASMNGYASSNIAPTLRGVKTLVYARAPAAVVLRQPKSGPIPVSASNSSPAGVTQRLKAGAPMVILLPK